MKKFISFIAGLFLLCGTAQAQTAPVQIVGKETQNKALQGVLGIDISGVGISLTDGLDITAEDAFSAITLSAGVKIMDRIALTGFYQFSSEEDKTTYAYSYYLSTFGNYKTTTSFKAYGVDASLYLPVSEKFNFIASAGLGYYDFTLDEEFNSMGSFYSSSSSEDHIGARLGIGAEVKLNDRIALSGNLRYVLFDYDDDFDYVEDLAEFGLGIKFYF